MKKAVAAALLALVIPAMAQAKPIEKFKAAGPSPSPILQGAIIPAGSEMIYLSGQLASPIDPAKPMSPTLTVEDLGDTKTQTISTLTKIKSILEAHGYKMADIFKMTVFVAAAPDKGGKMDFAGMNEGFKQFFNTPENPTTVARSAFQVAALAGPAFLVEIEVIAAKPPAK